VSERLAAELEAAALRRSVESQGGSATIIARGDPERGSLLLLLLERGRFEALIERALDASGSYRWRRCGPESPSPAEIDQFVASRRKYDSDLWAIELDVPSAERFVVELPLVG